MVFTRTPSSVSGLDVGGVIRRAAFQPRKEMNVHTDGTSVMFGMYPHALSNLANNEEQH